MSSEFIDQRALMLRDWFAFMVPFYIEDIRKSGVDPIDEARRLSADQDFMHRLTFCEDMLFGAFDQDRKRSKDAYAQVIALLSFAPGGVKTWGLHFEAARGPWYCQRISEVAS